MHARPLESQGLRMFVVVFGPGEEPTAGLVELAKREGLDGAFLTAIGAFQDVTLGYFHWDTKEYERITLREQVEVLTLAGNVARGPDGTPRLHAHVVVGKRDGSAHGGHLLGAHVRPTLEVTLVESPSHLRRRTDPVTGLALLPAR